MIQLKLIYGPFGQSKMHSTLSETSQEQKQMIQYIREAKSLLSSYIYTVGKALSDMRPKMACRRPARPERIGALVDRRGATQRPAGRPISPFLLRPICAQLLGPMRKFRRRWRRKWRRERRQISSRPRGALDLFCSTHIGCVMDAERVMCAWMSWAPDLP